LSLFCFEAVCLVMAKMSTAVVAFFNVKTLLHLICFDRGVIVANVQIWAADRLKGFYKGCGTNLLRTTPAAALTFTSFELIQRHIKIYAQDKRDRKAADATAS